MDWKRTIEMEKNIKDFIRKDKCTKIAHVNKKETL